MSNARYVSHTFTLLPRQYDHEVKWGYHHSLYERCWLLTASPGSMADFYVRTDVSVGGTQTEFILVNVSAWIPTSNNWHTKTDFNSINPDHKDEGERLLCRLEFIHHKVSCISNYQTGTVGMDGGMEWRVILSVYLLLYWDHPPPTSFLDDNLHNCLHFW